ncbi:MAG: hypothetical protein ACJ76Z_04285 [Thermoleophilaceae bacterium]
MSAARVAVAVVAAALAIGITGWPANGADPASEPAPDGYSQAPKDGCQRNPVGLLTFTSPEWVFVYGDQETKRIEGSVLEDTSHPAPGGGDLPEGHEWYDFNGDIKPDDPTTPLVGIDHSTGQLNDSLHTERESGQVPVAAWMTAGDHAVAWGSWIWDCGHWGPGLDFSKPTDEANRDYVMPGSGELPGDTAKDVGNGESTEFHPVKAYAITRTNPYFPPVEETETDFYVSNYGTTAHAEEVCSAKAVKTGAPTLGPDYTECLQDPRNRHWEINDTDYSFFVPAPPRPQGAPAWPRVTVVDNPGNVGPGPQPILDVRRNGVQVTIPFKGFRGVDAMPQCPVAETNPQHSILPPYDCPSQAMSKAVFVGWDGKRQRIPADVVVTLDKVTVHHSLDDPQLDSSSQVPPGEYGINMDANGLWAYVNDYATGLDQVNSGQSFTIGKSFRLRVKDGGRLRLFFPTRECDLPHMNPCFATPEVAEDNDGPGDAKVVFPTVADAVGDHVIKGGSAADPNWELTYSVKQVAPARIGSAADAGPPGGPIGELAARTYPNAGSPGSGRTGSNAAGARPRSGVRGGCVDAFTPVSRVLAHSVGRELRMRGRAADRGCRGGAAKVSRVEIAVARRDGAGCSFLGTNGRFGAASSCTPRSFARASGTTKWRFARRLHLTRGRYIAFSRAIDRAGNVEYRARRGNRVRFSVR